MQLLIATANVGKIREFRAMLGSDRFNWHELSEFPTNRPVRETGQTFRANACLKAAEYARRHHMWSLADDSGLSVDALQGNPGVTSARWAQLHGAGQGDASNNALLLRQLENLRDPDRSGRFVCVLALADPLGRVVVTVRDTVEGRIIRSPRGPNGFGYDPLFLIEDLGRTTAELSPEDKDRISHRGKALRRLRDLMRQLGLE